MTTPTRGAGWDPAMPGAGSLAPLPPGLAERRPVMGTAAAAGSNVVSPIAALLPPVHAAPVVAAAGGEADAVLKADHRPPGAGGAADPAVRAAADVRSAALVPAEVGALANEGPPTMHAATGETAGATPRETTSGLGSLTELEMPLWPRPRPGLATVAGATTPGGDTPGSAPAAPNSQVANPGSPVGCSTPKAAGASQLDAVGRAIRAGAGVACRHMAAVVVPVARVGRAAWTVAMRIVATGPRRHLAGASASATLPRGQRRAPSHWPRRVAEGASILMPLVVGFLVGNWYSEADRPSADVAAAFGGPSRSAIPAASAGAPAAAITMPRPAAAPTGAAGAAPSTTTPGGGTGGGTPSASAGTGNARAGGDWADSLRVPTSVISGRRAQDPAAEYRAVAQRLGTSGSSTSVSRRPGAAGGGGGAVASGMGGIAGPVAPLAVRSAPLDRVRPRLVQRLGGARVALYPMGPAPEREWQAAVWAVPGRCGAPIAIESASVARERGTVGSWMYAIAVPVEACKDAGARRAIPLRVPTAGERLQLAQATAASAVVRGLGAHAAAPADLRDVAFGTVGGTRVAFGVFRAAPGTQVAPRPPAQQLGFIAVEAGGQWEILWGVAHQAPGSLVALAGVYDLSGRGAPEAFFVVRDGAGRPRVLRLGVSNGQWAVLGATGL